MPSDFFFADGDLAPGDAATSTSNTSLFLQQVKNALDVIPGEYVFDPDFAIDWIGIKEQKTPPTVAAAAILNALQRIPELRNAAINSATRVGTTVDIKISASFQGVAGDLVIVLGVGSPSRDENAGAHLYWIPKR